LEKPIVDPRTVLIVSDDAEFSRQVAARWQSERAVPAFTVVGGDPNQGFDYGSFDLTIVGPIRPDACTSVLRAVDAGRKAVILVSDVALTESLRSQFPRLLVLRRHEGWPDTVLLLALEVLRRVDAVNRAQRAEHVNALLKCHATLGQYIIEMRHTINNALTSVLGNAELLLLEPGAFSAGVRSQIDTIRNMALRMHEILQRFSSLEKEMMFVEKQAAKEQRTQIQAAAVGQ
jgi:signal transduction histidine kinase